MTIVRVTAAFALCAVCATGATAHAQEPDTRAEQLRQQREQKSKTLGPPERSRLEQALFDLESGRLFERLLNPAEGLYPKIGNITSGSGFSFGPGYRDVALFDGPLELTSFAQVSFKRYWIADARVRAPRLAHGRLVLDAHVQRSEFPEEEFFGLGPDSARANQVTYGLRNTAFGGMATYRVSDLGTRGSLDLSGGVDRLSPRVSSASGAGRIASIFSDATVPGLTAESDFVRYEAVADLNYREPRGNPRTGGRYALTFQRYDDLDGDQYRFSRVEADVQQYIPLLRDRRVLALHALASVSDADAGADIPFYFQRALGGPDDLRGFRRFRFRDRHALLLQAEYRWEIFTAVDGAIFYDAGKVASRVEDLNLRHLESDYGIGFRFGTKNGVFLRVEGAFGSSGGKQFIFRFGHVF